MFLLRCLKLNDIWVRLFSFYIVTCDVKIIVKISREGYLCITEPYREGVHLTLAWPRGEEQGAQIDTTNNRSSIGKDLTGRCV